MVLVSLLALAGAPSVPAQESQTATTAHAEGDAATEIEAPDDTAAADAAPGDEATEPELSPEEAQAQAAVHSALKSIALIRQAIADDKDTIRELTRAIARTQDDVELEPLNLALEEAREDLRKQQLNLESIATGIPVAEYRNAEPQEYDLQSEVVNLLQPLVYALKSVTRDSRQIEKPETNPGREPWESRHGHRSRR